MHGRRVTDAALPKDPNQGILSRTESNSKGDKEISSTGKSEQFEGLTGRIRAAKSRARDKCCSKEHRAQKSKVEYCTWVTALERMWRLETVTDRM